MSRNARILSVSRSCGACLSVLCKGGFFFFLDWGAEEERGRLENWGGDWGGMGRKNFKGGDFAPDDFAKDTSCGGHFRGGLVVVVVVVIFYCRGLVCLMVGLMFGCPAPAPRWLGIGVFYYRYYKLCSLRW